MAIPPELETSRLTLRRLDSEDAPFVVRLLNEPSFLQNIGDRGVRNIEDAHRYLREGPLAMYQAYGFGLWHASRKSDGAAVGMCGLLKRDTLPDVDIGYAYLPEFWGQGYALEAAEATVRHAALKFGLRRLIGVVSQGNTGSIRVLEKVGMRFERLYPMHPGEPEVRLYSCTLEPPRD
ncbi:MAG TPA: GNAT family N-acetyltransferase [Vicinamibacterales bacterium]|nr:GNAT family N-acetyltransferase [Vicinamibacterales bacterium]